MTPTTLRIIGIGFLVAAAAVAVVNLKRVADLEAYILPPVLIFIGLAFIARAKGSR